MPVKSIPSATRKSNVGAKEPNSLVGFIEMHPDMAIAGGVVLTLLIVGWAISRSTRTPATTNPTTPAFLHTTRRHG